MKRKRLWAAVGAFSFLATVGSLALLSSPEAKNPGFSGGSYLTVIKDAEGNFASRSIITLHADHTMLAVDSGQQGPTNYFGSQLGTWQQAGNHQIAARTMDFCYPLSPAPGIARADYAIRLAPDRRHVTGTITVSAFPLDDGNPQEEEGTPIGTFTFEGEWIKP
ncbi:MAG: hypothetical protein M1404_06755 [Acidobacteria bacterium]|nr:hypothetical protein [Acidobacteriota bacterium]